jgi:hypothetical protein
VRVAASPSIKRNQISCILYKNIIHYNVNYHCLLKIKRIIQFREDREVWCSVAMPLLCKIVYKNEAKINQTLPSQAIILINI